MALPLLGSTARRRDQVVAIDLGGFSAKAVHLQKKEDQYSLLGYALVEGGAGDPNGSTVPADQRLRQVSEALGGRCKQVSLALGCSDSLLRTAELPLVPVSDMRTMLKFNAKTYLQQDLNDYAFDCYVLPPRSGTKMEPAKAGQKSRVLVGGAKNRLVQDLATAVRSAGLMPEAIVPELVCPVNAFEVAQPEAFAKEAVGLVDLGFRNSSICVLMNGELVLSRVVAIGGERLTTGLAEALGTSFAEAENIKLGLAHEVQTTMATLISPLARELRASLDYFEHQHDRTVGQVYVSGAAARSEHVLETLQTELMVPCTAWNPLANMAMAVPPQQLGGIEAAAPQLTVAVGAALAAF